MLFQRLLNNRFCKFTEGPPYKIRFKGLLSESGLIVIYLVFKICPLRLRRAVRSSRFPVQQIPAVNETIGDSVRF